jgi:hypothetical protein
MAARVGIFLTFELDGGERHFDPPAAVSSEKGSHYLRTRRLRGPQKRSGLCVKKKESLPQANTS